MPKRPTTFAPDSTTLVSSAELAQVAGIDLDAVNNWLQRGIISRSPIGGRQMKNRLFQMETVYKTAFIADLVKVGIPPSTAADAVNELWRQWGGKEPVEERRLYALIVPTDGNWAVLLASQKPWGGALHRLGRSSGEIELPKQAFSVIPISDVLERVSKAVASLLGKQRRSDVGYSRNQHE
jgi:hypothetical protein